ncbi:Gfo/Idh/MocA family protein [Bacteroidota bacterium]
MTNNQLKRREFIKGFSMLAGATMLSSNSWLSSVLAQEAGSTSVVRLGVIGVGSRGKLLTTLLLANPGVEIVAYCDNYLPNLEEAGNMIGNKARAFTNYKNLLEMEEIQGVVIATPLHAHAHISIDAMQKGKHVFCEKAMAITPSECLDMLMASRETGRILQIGHQRLFSIRYLLGIEMIREGKLGQITQIRACWHRNNDWRRPVPSPELERKINWRLYREYSRGLMTELATHQIQVANWVLQEVPVEISGSGSINYWKDGREVFDNVNLVYTYPSGSHLIYDSLISNKKYGCEEQVMGPLGTLEMETAKIYLENPPPAPGIIQLLNQIEKNVFDVVPIGGPSWVPEDPYEDKGRYITEALNSDGTDMQMEAFVNSVRENRGIPGNLEEGYYAGVACLLGDQAMMERKVVTWPDEYMLTK